MKRANDSYNYQINGGKKDVCREFFFHPHWMQKLSLRIFLPPAILYKNYRFFITFYVRDFLCVYQTVAIVTSIFASSPSGQKRHTTSTEKESYIGSKQEPPVVLQLRAHEVSSKKIDQGHVN